LKTKTAGADPGFRTESAPSWGTAATLCPACRPYPEISKPAPRDGQRNSRPGCWSMPAAGKAFRVLYLPLQRSTSGSESQHSEGPRNAQIRDSIPSIHNDGSHPLVKLHVGSLRLRRSILGLELGVDDAAAADLINRKRFGSYPMAILEHAEGAGVDGFPL